MSLNSSEELNELCQKLLMEQQELAKLSLSPYQEQEWVRNKIYPKWEKLLSGSSLWNQSEIRPSSGSAFKVIAHRNEL